MSLLLAKKDDELKITPANHPIPISHSAVAVIMFVSLISALSFVYFGKDLIFYPLISSKHTTLLHIVAIAIFAAVCLDLYYIRAYKVNFLLAVSYIIISLLFLLFSSKRLSSVKCR